MKKGDRVRPLENHPLMGISKRNVGVITSQTRRYKLLEPDPDGKGWGQDVEVKFNHKYGTCIFQSYELRKVGR